jgi:FkbM family methyltransferase
MSALRGEATGTVPGAAQGAAITLDIPGVEQPLSLHVHGDQDLIISRNIRRDGIWEPFETELLVRFLHAGASFVDVGANLGYFTVLAAQLVGEGGAVVAFEPDPANFDLLRLNCDQNKLAERVEAVRAGLSLTNRVGRLYLSEDNLGDHQIYAGDGERDSLGITLHNGSDFLRPRLRQLDLLKIDVQGAEYEVIAGLLPFLQSLARCPRMIIELTPYSLRRAGTSGRALIELLAELEQAMWIIDHLEHRLVASTADELALWCDNVDACEGDQGFMNILLGPA